MSFACASFAQNNDEKRELYFGIDLGPKMDIYNHTGSSAQYHPNVEIIPDIGANAGVIGGVKLDGNYLVEIGLYKNDYKMKMRFISDQNNVFFQNTLVRTITSIGVPISFNMRLKRGSDKHQWYAGVGFMPLLNVRTDQEEVFQSVVEEIQNDQGQVTDMMAYAVSEQTLDGSIVTANLSLRYNTEISERLMFHVMTTARLGVSGKNEFTTSHSTMNILNVVNTFSTKGSGYNLNIGFRYFFGGDPDDA